MVVEGYERLERYVRSRCAAPEAELAKIRQAFRPVRAERGTLLVRAGDEPSLIGFVARGLVRLYYADADGRERTYGYRADDELVCAYSAALRREPAPMNIAALEDTELLVASRDAFERLCAGHPCWEQLIAGLTAELYLRLERRQRDLLLADAPTRYQRFLAEQPALAARLTQREIASYIGVTPVALSRIRSRLISVNDTAAAGS